MVFFNNLLKKSEISDELKHQKFHVEESIAKYQKELDSLKKAYELKLLSEETYLKSKERILEKLNRLRKVDIQLLKAKGFIKDKET